MGDVYRAADSKLGRDVAIKLLPEAFARDPDRVVRFEREARLLASLNDPNIAAIYGFEKLDGRYFLVMELVPGETLAERIRRGPIPLDETLAILKQIAEALEAAHEKGIIHRDLKPANIKITPAGRLKVLDFGLAKAYEPATANVNVSNSPTLVSAASTGVLLGTASYMSPEQAKGKEVDKRTDIFAFGCVAFEMLSGKKVFEGEDVSDILSAVLRVEPDWAKVPSDLPHDIRNLLRLCLEKNPKNRLSDASDVRLLVEQALKEPAASAGVPAPVSVSRAKFAWMAFAAAMSIAFTVLAAVHFREKTPPEMRLEINTPPTSAPGGFALSPDGEGIVFVASGDGPQRLWLRTFDNTEARPIAGTEGADFPFWAPDGRSIGFAANGKLQRIDVAGGPTQILADAPAFRGATWNVDGVILFAPASAGPLLRIAASGGAPVAVTKVGPPQVSSHRFPQFLPDGQHFLFYALGAAETAGVYWGSLNGSEPKRLTTADTAALYLAEADIRRKDAIVFMRQRALLAQPFDTDRGELSGDTTLVAGSVDSIQGYSVGAFSVSANGRLAYRSAGDGRTQLSWYDRTGKILGSAGGPDSNTLHTPELSADGRQLAAFRSDRNNAGIWLMDLSRGDMSRLSFDPDSSFPVWSPDGKYIAFDSTRKGAVNLYVKASNGSGAEELLLDTPNNKRVQDWSRDGRLLLYEENGAKTSWDLWALPLNGAKVNSSDPKPVPVATTASEEMQGQLSPDGHWVAYRTNESGRPEIVVQAFPNPTGKWQVSANGGGQPRWRADGRELYFIAPDGNMMAAPITVVGETLTAGTPTALFQTYLSATSNLVRAIYAVARDGRFLINQQLESTLTPITLVLYWKPK
jgi:Tol biopolymer transport system component